MGLCEWGCTVRLQVCLWVWLWGRAAAALCMLRVLCVLCMLCVLCVLCGCARVHAQQLLHGLPLRQRQIMLCVVCVVCVLLHRLPVGQRHLQLCMLLLFIECGGRARHV